MVKFVFGEDVLACADPVVLVRHQVLEVREVADQEAHCLCHALHLRTKYPLPHLLSELPVDFYGFHTYPTWSLAQS